MDSLLAQNEKRPMLSKGLIAGVVIGVVAIAALIGGVLMLRPSMADQKAAALEGAVREDSPEFAVLLNDLVFADKDSVESAHFNASWLPPGI